MKFTKDDITTVLQINDDELLVTIDRSIYVINLNFIAILLKIAKMIININMNIEKQNQMINVEKNEKQGFVYNQQNQNQVYNNNVNYYYTEDENIRIKAAKIILNWKNVTK